MDTVLPAFRWITTDVELKNLCEQLCREPALALDTEFIRTNTFYPKTALFQIATQQDAFLIDPLTIRDFSPLSALLQNHSTVKVLHSCSEDLEVCKYFLKTLPQPLFDTQIAAALVNLGFSMSYSALVKAIAGVELPKGETRSDWLARPLRKEQEHYAVLDVVYLLPIYAELQARLQQLNRSAWIEEECAALLEAASTESVPEEYYKKIKASWKLNPIQLSVLQALTSWRERKAQELNKPRNHIVPEKVLFEVAKNLCDQPSKVKSLLVGPLGRYKKQIEPVANIVATTLAEKEHNALETIPKPLPPRSKELVNAIRHAAEAIAESQQIPLEILLRKADIEAFARSGLYGDVFQLPSRLQGWRKAIIGDPMLALAASLDSQTA